MNVIVATHDVLFVLDRPFRWRDPRCRSMAATDPAEPMLFSTECTLGYAAGDTNLYRYCFNSPTNATDPSGHVANLVTGAVGAGIGAIFGAGAYLYQYATGGVEEFSCWDMGAYTLGGAAAGGVAGLTFGASLAVAGGLGMGTVGTTAVAGGMTGIAAGATGGAVTGVGTTMDDAWRGDVTWGQVGMAGLTGAGRGAFYGGIAGTVGGAAFPIAASLTSGGIAGGFIAGSSSAMLGDFSAQWAGIAIGLQDRYDTGQTAFAGLGGGLLGGYGGYRDPKLGGLVDSRAWREPFDAVRHPILTTRTVVSNVRRAFDSTLAATLKPGRFARYSIPARGSERNFTRSERAAINELGQRYGCHTCGTRDPGTRTGNFIPDHQTPNQLASQVRQRLYPHCKSCSSRQGGHVSASVRRQGS